MESDKLCGLKSEEVGPEDLGLDGSTCNNIVSYLEYYTRNRSPFFLKGDEVLIGRNPNADVVVPSTNVSRVHAILKRDGENSWLIKDSMSLNGVYVNEKKCAPGEWHRLESGDTVHLGPPTEQADFCIRFVQRQKQPDALDRPLKIPRMEESREKVVVCEEKLELERKLKELEEQLRHKEQVEHELQNKLREQESQSAKERERLMQERAEEESKVRRSLEEMLKAKERMLQEALDSQHEEQAKRNTEEESKAKQVEEELAEVKRLRERAKADVLGHFGDLMETEFTCAICSELFVEAVTLACSHTFCKQCICQWKKKKKECPICRAKVKGGSDTRSLAIDNFIEGMVPHLDPQVARRRRDLLQERAAGPGKKAQHRVSGDQVGRGGAISLLLRPQLNLAGIRQPTVVVARLLAGSSSQSGIGQNLPSGAVLCPAGRGQRLPFPTPDVRTFAIRMPFFSAGGPQQRMPGSRTIRAPESATVATVAPVNAPREVAPTVQVQTSSTMPSDASTSGRPESAIVISDSDEEGNASAEGESGAYYGGYGRCFKCRRKGHWSNGCPFDHR